MTRRGMKCLREHQAAPTEPLEAVVRRVIRDELRYSEARKLT